MYKYQVIIRFEMDAEFMALASSHRAYINSLIEKNVIDSYAVSMKSQHVYIIMTAKNKTAVKQYLSKAPLYKYWRIEIDELFFLDSLIYRLPAIQPN